MSTGAPRHSPAEQKSLTVQPIPSSHLPSLSVETQPAVGSQTSVVQTLPSSQR